MLSGGERRASARQLGYGWGLHRLVPASIVTCLRLALLPPKILRAIPSCRSAIIAPLSAPFQTLQAALTQTLAEGQNSRSVQPVRDRPRFRTAFRHPAGKLLRRLCGTTYLRRQQFLLMVPGLSPSPNQLKGKSTMSAKIIVGRLLLSGTVSRVVLMAPRAQADRDFTNFRFAASFFPGRKLHNQLATNAAQRPWRPLEYLRRLSGIPRPIARSL